MSDWFEDELKKMPGGLHLRRSSLRNRAAGLHPETWQIWGRGEVTGHPYLIMFLVGDEGQPRRPCVNDLNRLRNMDRARIPHIGDPNYWDTRLAAADAEAERKEEKGWDAARELQATEGLDRWMRKRGMRKTMRTARTPRGLS